MSPSFVVDASVILAWYDPREDNAYAEKILDALKENTAITPPLCCLEVNNVLRLFEKKKLITRLDLEKAAEFVDSLPILLDKNPLDFSMPLALSLSRKYDLTIYDACYLELAVRFNLPMATLDHSLIKAVKAVGLQIF